MKTLGRILVIVAAMIVVMGITYSVVTARGVSANGLPRFEEGNRHLSQDGQFVPQPRPPFQNGEFEEHHEGRGRGGGGWMFSFIKNVGVITLLVAVIVIPKGIARKKKWSKPALAE